jgi:predicted nucleic acid-binding protein
LEVANALQIATRRKRIATAYRDRSLRNLGSLRIEVDQETDARAWLDTLELSDRYQLTLYDAAYLELALRRGLAIATRDQDLENAARIAGVTVLPTS